METSLCHGRSSGTLSFMSMKFLFLVLVTQGHPLPLSSSDSRELISLGFSIQTLAIGIPHNYKHAVSFIKLLPGRKGGEII